MAPTITRIEELEAKLAKVKAEVKVETEKERRLALAVGAYRKLTDALREALTSEECQAVNGMYLFLHAEWGSDLCVDLVQDIPSNTDKGQGRALDKVLSTLDIE